MEQYEQGGMPSALHQTTLRVNSLSISDGQPNQQRKRNREVEDHSFRVDKMSEAPSSIPRMNAMLTPEEYHLQRLQRDDSLNNAISMVPPWIGHSNSGRSNGSTGSGSLLEFMAQDSHSSSMLMSLDKLGQANPTPPPDKSGGMVSGQNMLNLSQQGSLLLGSSAPSILGNQSAMSMLGAQTNMFGISGRNSPPTSYQGFMPQQQQQQQQSFMQQMPVQAMSMQGQQIPVQTMTMQGQQIPMGQISQNSNGLLQSQNSLSFGLPSQNSLTLGLNSQNSLNGGTSFQLQQQNSLNSGLFGVGGGSFLNQAFGSGASLSGFGAAPQAPNLSLGSHQMGYDASFGSLPGQLESFLNTMGPRQSHAVPDLPQPSLFGNIVNHHQQPPELFGTSTMNQNSPPKMKKLVGTATISAKPAKSRVPANGNTEKYVSWSPEQEAELTEAVKLLGTSDWDAVASRISGHRTGPQCSRHWENKLSPSIKRGQWSPEEDEALRALVEKAQARGLGLLDIPWEDIKPYIPGRTLKQVRERWRSNLDPSIIRGDWTQEEDEIIIHMRDVQGLGWASIARALKGRTEHSVKTRHRSMQRAQKRPWTQKEDHVIIELVKTGANWTAIANELKNRTPASVQSRWSELSTRG